VKVYENKYFNIKEINSYYSINFPQRQVVVLPIVNNNRILFIKAIRPILNQSVIELPAGGVNKKESTLLAARRELMEETGVYVELNNLSYLRELNTIPSRTSQMLKIYRADIDKKEFDDRKAHDDEVEGILLLSYKDVISKIKSGEIFVSTTIAICLEFLINENTQ
jgi:ADP-ribose pyrophosphatase